MLMMAAMPSGLCHLKIGISLNIEEDDEENFDLGEQIIHVQPENNHITRNVNYHENTITKFKVGMFTLCNVF